MTMSASTVRWINIVAIVIGVIAIVLFLDGWLTNKKSVPPVAWLLIMAVSAMRFVVLMATRQSRRTRPPDPPWPDLPHPS